MDSPDGHSRRGRLIGRARDLLLPLKNIRYKKTTDENPVNAAGAAAQANITAVSVCAAYFD